MSSETVRLEGFNASLKGQRIWIVGQAHTVGSLVLNRLSQVEEDFLGRGRKILCIQNPRDIAMRWSQKIPWDAVFRIRETQDMRLAATYIQNSIKPLRVIWIGDEPPLTFLSVCSSPDICLLGASTQNPRMSWSAIFWDSSCLQATVEEGLTPRMGSAFVSSLKLASVLHELKVSSVGFVWSSINETDKRGCVYWCDFEDAGKHSAPTIEPIEAIEYLKDLTLFLEKRF
jgi:hypothetical protein